jgi:hypothetical protein
MCNIRRFSELRSVHVGGIGNLLCIQAMAASQLPMAFHDIPHKNGSFPNRKTTPDDNTKSI